MTTATEMNLRGRKVPGLLLLLAIASLLLFPLLGKQGLTDPDESAYVESVREMMDRGDWLVPRLYGQPILDKPILVYWVIGASFQLFGKSELSATRRRVRSDTDLRRGKWPPPPECKSAPGRWVRRSPG